MAEFPRGRIKGHAIRGDESIYPNNIWEPPNQSRDNKNTVNFTCLVKAVTDDAKRCIKSDGGFKGNRKKYGEKNDGADLCGRFSWWSVYIDNATADRIRKEVDYHKELAPIYEDGSMYGTNLFREELDELMRSYEKSIQGQSEIRVFSTFAYKREVQHAIVVAPSTNETFQRHHLLAQKGSNGDYVWLHPDIVTRADDDNDGYIWHPFSTVKWVHYAYPHNKQKWANLAFAFYLDPLPNKMIPVPGVDNDDNWEECNLQRMQLLKQYDPNE